MQHMPSTVPGEHGWAITPGIPSRAVELLPTTSGTDIAEVLLRKGLEFGASRRLDEETDMTMVQNRQIYVGNRNLNPADGWTPFEWVEPVHGPQVKGEVLMIRPEGTSGTLMAGLWRTGVGIVGCAADGSSTVPYTAPLGDETMLLLEGRAHLLNEETGEEYDFPAGEVICLPSGPPVRWTSEAPFVKKFWVITNEALPG
jgi:uncharacterized cupin superfamily protein